MIVAEEQRRGQLAANVRAVRERLAEACAAARRTPDEVTLVAVTKTHPASDVVLLAELGVADFGENRDQEAAPKAAAVAEALAARSSPPVRWHFVGQLQRNKCRSVVRYAHMIHSVDRVRLAATLVEAARRHRAEPVDVLVQVSLDGAVGRGGAAAGSALAAQPNDDADLDRVLGRVAEADSLRLRGVMAIAPPAWQPERAFERLAEIATRVRADYPGATLISAGMSGDVEAAIAYGATHVRMGTALLGNRPALM